MRSRSENLQRRDALIGELRAAGWSLRKIAADRRVKLSPQAVSDRLKVLAVREKVRAAHPDAEGEQLETLVKRALRRQRDAGQALPALSGAQLDALELYRAAFAERDPAAVQAWREFEIRCREAEDEMAQERHGRPFAECSWEQQQVIRDLAVGAEQARLAPAEMVDAD